MRTTAFFWLVQDIIYMSKRDDINNRLTYLLTDYKWFWLAGLVVAALVIHLLVAAFSQKETVLYAMLVDCHADASQNTLETDAIADLGFDPGTQRVQIESSLLFEDTQSGSYAMASLSRFLADIGSGKLDVCGMLEDDFVKYDNAGTWIDLRQVMGSELPADEEKLLVRDGRVIGIYADALPVLRDYGCYDRAYGRGVLGIIHNAPHMENARAYLLFLTGVSG